MEGFTPTVPILKTKELVTPMTPTLLTERVLTRPFDSDGQGFHRIKNPIQSPLHPSLVHPPSTFHYQRMCQGKSCENCTGGFGIGGGLSKGVFLVT